MRLLVWQQAWAPIARHPATCKQNHRIVAALPPSRRLCPECPLSEDRAAGHSKKVARACLRAKLNFHRHDAAAERLANAGDNSGAKIISLPNSISGARGGVAQRHCQFASNCWMALGHGVLTPVDPQELAARPQVNGHAASPEYQFNLLLELALDAFNQQARLRRTRTEEVFLADSICVALSGSSDLDSQSASSGAGEGLNPIQFGCELHPEPPGP